MEFLSYLGVLAALVCTFLVVGGMATVFIVGACEFMWDGE